MVQGSRFVVSVPDLYLKQLINLVKMYSLHCFQKHCALYQRYCTLYQRYCTLYQRHCTLYQFEEQYSSGKVISCSHVCTHIPVSNAQRSSAQFANPNSLQALQHSLPIGRLDSQLANGLHKNRKSLRFQVATHEMNLQSVMHS